MTYKELYRDALETIELLKAKNKALKIRKSRYKHFKGNEYTIICEDVHDCDDPDSKTDTIYIDMNGVKWRRPSFEFHGYKNDIKRFVKIEKE